MSNLLKEVEIVEGDTSYLLTAYDESAHLKIGTLSDLQTSDKTSIVNAINSEITTREQADSNLQSAISSEVSAREQADSNLQSAISSEATAREQADSNLGTQINTETGLRTAADNYLHDLISSKGRTFMFIGDSYAEGHYSWESDVEGWCKYCKDYLGLDNAHYVYNGLGATGFCTPTTWYSLLNNYVVPEGVEISDIIIGGGYNDKDYNLNAIRSAIQQCDTLIKTKFPYAKVWLSFFGWSCDDSQWANLMNCERHYIICAGEVGWNYISNVNWTGHDYTEGSFYSDIDDTPFGSNFHPNNNGCKSIARAICNCLKGGTYTDYNPLNSGLLSAVTLDGLTATPSGTYVCSAINNVVSLFVPQQITTDLSTPSTITCDGRLVPFGKLTNGLLHGDANNQDLCKVRCILLNSDNNDLVLCEPYLTLRQGSLYLRFVELENNNWKTYSNIWRLQIQAFSVLGIDRTRA